MKKYLLSFACVFLILLIIAGVKVYPFMNAMSKVEIVEFDKNLTLVLGGGGNSAVLVGDKELLVIDSKIMTGKKILFELVKEKGKNKSIVLVNTHLHADHANGNSLYKDAKIIAGAYSKEQWMEENGSEGMPTEWLSGKKEISIGGETVILKNMGRAHTLEDVVVFFKNRKLLFMGDMLMVGMHPFLKSKHGSKISNYIQHQNDAMDEFQPKTIVPGHGRIGGRELVSEFQTYFSDTRSVAEKKMKLPQIEEKYKSWISFPFSSGTEKTVEYWKLELGL